MCRLIIFTKALDKFWFQRTWTYEIHFDMFPFFYLYKSLCDKSVFSWLIFGRIFSLMFWLWNIPCGKNSYRTIQIFLHCLKQALVSSIVLESCTFLLLLINWMKLFLMSLCYIFVVCRIHSEISFSLQNWLFVFFFFCS